MCGGAHDVTEGKLYRFKRPRPGPVNAKAAYDLYKLRVMRGTTSYYSNYRDGGSLTGETS